MGRKVLIAALGATLGVAAWWLSRPGPAVPTPEARAPGEALEIPPAPRPAAVVASAASALLPADAGKPLALRGRVLGLDGGAAAGVEVQAFAEHGAGMLERLPCACATATADEGEEDRCDPLEDCACATTPELLDFLAREPERPVAARAVTGGDGSFRLEVDDPDVSYRIEATVPGAEAMLINRPAGADVVVRSWPVEPPSLVEGTVVDERGRGLADVPVMAFDGYFLDARRTVSDAGGRFQFLLPEKSWHVLAAVAGLLPDFSMPLGNQPLRLVLAHPHRLSGRVLRRGAPVPGAKVTVGPVCQREAISDAEGRFSFMLAPDSHTLDADLPGWHGSSEVDVEPGRHVADADVELAAEGGLDGRVVDSSGKPIAGARVTFDSGHHPHAVRLPRAMTDADGAFRWRGFGPGSLRLDVSARGQLPMNRQVHWAEGEVTDVSIVLTEGYALSGTVVDGAGHPVRGAWVEIRSCPTDGDCSEHFLAETSENGTFANDQLPRGEYLLVARKRGLRTAEVRCQVPQAGVSIVLSEAPVLAGQVVDAAGAGAPNVAVLFEGVRDGRPVLREHLRSGPGGAFQRACPVDARYRVHAVSYDPAGASVTAAVAEVTVGPSAPPPLLLRLSPGASIVGVVQEASGAPVADAKVLAVPDVGEAERERAVARVAFELEPPPGRAFTTAKGAFTLQGLPAGDYHVWAEAGERGRSEVVQVSTGASPVVLVVKPR